MKYLINRCWGGFSISEQALAAIGMEDKYSASDYFRTYSPLIEMVEVKGSDFVSGRCAKLKIVEIPDEATDWELNDYDGMESIIAVVDGKIQHIA